jgi:predicted alpha/beta superfamily hydrolase
MSFRSEVLNEERILNIYLPGGYHHNSQHPHPVVYLLDGSVDEDFTHVAGLAGQSNLPRLQECVVIGIANVDRTRDFTFPTTVEKDKMVLPSTGGSAKFIQFLEEELQPFVQRNYSNNGVTTLIGRSLGGLLATEVLFTRPDLFTNYIILSPSLWWDDQSLLKQPPKISPSIKSIYIGVGRNEHKIIVKSAKTLSKKVQAQQSEGLRVRYKSFSEASHDNILQFALFDAFDWLQ